MGIIQDTSGAQDARVNKFLPSVGGGIGYELWQFGLALVAFAIVFLPSLLITRFVFPGMFKYLIAAAVAAGMWAMMAPNYMNTHHKDTKKHVADEFAKRVHHKRVVNDKRVRTPRAEREDYLVEVTNSHPDTDVLKA
jgi:hypothetical protein